MLEIGSNPKTYNSKLITYNLFTLISLFNATQYKTPSGH